MAAALYRLEASSGGKQSMECAAPWRSSQKRRHAATKVLSQVLAKASTEQCGVDYRFLLYPRSSEFTAQGASLACGLMTALLLLCSPSYPFYLISTVFECMPKLPPQGVPLITVEQATKHRSCQFLRSFSK
ncbi:hypothetical protein [Comamonas sp.]|uniref:hypothetical protein n=1 Tax=Comamonas sp. TaxID=34028 RepID=UPI003A8E26A8